MKFLYLEITKSKIKNVTNVNVNVKILIWCLISNGLERHALYLEKTECEKI